MAYNTYSLTPDAWTLVGDNVTHITFQNIGQYPLYINFNSSNSAPAEATGLLYNYFDTEIKRDVTTLTFKSTPNYVFAKAASANATILVETT